MSKGPIDVSVKVNLNGIGDKLIELEPKIVRSLLKKALKSVGSYWVDAVRAKVPVLHGDLKNSIMSTVRTRKGKKNSDGLPAGTVTVGPGLVPPANGEKFGPGVYGQFVEFGLKRKDYAPEPFLRPTFDSTAEQAVAVFADALKDGLAEAIE